MAAVLCGAIGDLLKGSCNAVAKVLTLPCRACGMACTSCNDMLTSPFFLYLALTFGLNMPGVVYGVKVLMSDCLGLTTWLLGNGVLCLAHMLAAYYIVNKIREAKEPSEDTFWSFQAEDEEEAPKSLTMPKLDQTGGANSFTRIKHVMCYDKTMAVYIVVFITWVMWLSYGIAKRLMDIEGCEEQVHYLDVSIICGYLYLSLVFVAFGCSLCCIR